MKIGVAGINNILDIKGCHKSGSHSKPTNKLHGSIYLETITSLIWRLFGESSYQNCPILVNSGPKPSINRCTSKLHAKIVNKQNIIKKI
ncbi:MAG: hypothetical protein ACJ0BU_01545 [Candidatus Puniceispirillales bacterium]